MKKPSKLERLSAGHTAKAAYRQKILFSTVAIVVFSAMLFLLVVFAVGKVSSQNGMFEITAQNKGEGHISLSNTADFSSPTVMIQSKSPDKMDNISERVHIPADIDEVDGPHSGENYFAHTFYLRNTGETTVDIEEKISILSKFKGADEAVRVKVYRDGAATAYAAMGEGGAPEYGTVPFLDEETAVLNSIKELAPGETVKYTVVVWIEGDDPQCTNDILGGFVRFAMNFTVINGPVN